MQLIAAMKTLLGEDARIKIERGIRRYNTKREFSEEEGSKGDGKGRGTAYDAPSKSPKEKKGLQWLRNKIKTKVYNTNLFQKSRDVSKLKMAFWVMRVQQTDVTNAYAKLLDAINVTSSHINDNIEIIGVASFGVIFLGIATVAANVPVRDMVLTFIVVAGIFYILLECGNVILCRKTKRGTQA